MRPKPDSPTRGPWPLRSGLDDRREHDAFVHELLDPVQDRLALLWVQLARLLPIEPVDVRVATVGADPTRDDEGLDAGGRVAEGGAPDPDETPELLFLIGLVERRSLERPEPCADPHGLE